MAIKVILAKIDFKAIFWLIDFLLAWCTVKDFFWTIPYAWNKTTLSNYQFIMPVALRCQFSTKNLIWYELLNVQNFELQQGSFKDLFSFSVLCLCYFWTTFHCFIETYDFILIYNLFLMFWTNFTFITIGIGII